MACRKTTSKFNIIILRMKQERQLSLNDTEAKVLRNILTEIKPNLYRDYEQQAVEEILRQLPNLSKI